MAIPEPSELEFWETIAKIGFIAVIFGVGGEITELISKWMEYCRRKEFSAQIKIRLVTVESFFFALLIVGLAVEFWGSQKVQLIADSQSELLRRENLLLEARIKPRRITPEQIKIITSKLRSDAAQAKCPVLVKFEDFDPEPRIFAQQIADVLQAGGFDVKLESEMASFPANVPPVTGVFFTAHNPPPPAAKSILETFIEAAVVPTNTFLETDGEGDGLTISVFPKPLQ